MAEKTANTMDYELDGEDILEEATTIERCLSFQVDDLILFLSTDYIVEIVNDYPITPLPMVPSFIRGMINLRGQILPVLDMRLCMDKPPAEYNGNIDMQSVRPIPVKRQQKLLNGMVDLGEGNVIMSFDCNVLLEKRY